MTNEDIQSPWVLQFHHILAPASVLSSRRKFEHLFTSRQISDMSAPFTLEELRFVLDSTKTTFPGLDGITYLRFRKLPSKALQFLLGIYNGVWRTCHVPSCWKEHIILLERTHPETDPETSLSSGLCNPLSAHRSVFLCGQNV